MMINLEYLIQDKELLKMALIDGLAVSKGKIRKCSRIECKNCEFNDLPMNCEEKRKEWLEAEHTPLYKKGDIILNKQGYLVFVVKDTGKDLVIVNNKDALEKEIRVIFIVMEYRDVERRVGNIYD